MALKRETDGSQKGKYSRDRGKGKQVIMTVVMAALGLVIVVGLTAKGFITSGERVAEVHTETGVSGGAVTGTSVSTESALSAKNEPERQVQAEEPLQTPMEMPIDTFGLEAFHGFMTENAYIIMEEQIKTECQKRQCTSAKKLNYQQTTEGSFDVASFVLLSDGGILRCDYNLKSGAVSIRQTEYSEADITEMHSAEMQAEQEALERQQAADKKKAELAKRKSQKKAAVKTKKDKGKSQKKSSGRKSAKPKKAKSESRKKTGKK